ncbi:thiopeptide-type bacteriocin biosynthesis protein [Christiangramia sp. SM2212]|uniref:Thiopeptide-type bacteriocin biosynthesis protein n=1 Tax=Christiangramia sediminicola TaxID=3073267 RepID=A0ABU1ERT5_9FLAO|nr:thiopeptide-type bacteriocin biosynthesis protein [Christiangramia sp. SM2212]MDR5591105.1 thiopeptide-type bacteriocin biosynthesis protein [Christiangramia sp. SM2212]
MRQVSIMGRRTFCIGEEWLYFKLYCGSVTADKILVEVIHPLIQKLIDNKIIEQWFFIRYQDPNSHLRIRFFSSDKEKIFKVISIFQPVISKLLKENIIWKVQTDTYQREIERYGTQTMEISERLFFLDSNLIVSFLSYIHGEEGEEIRWLFGLKIMDSILTCFQLNRKQKLAFVEFLRDAFEDEYKMNKTLKRQLNDRYRDKRNLIENFEKSDELRTLTPLIAIYEEGVTSVAEEILEYYKAEEPEVTIDYLISSYIHMTINRLFKSQNRLHEFVSYYFLSKYYKTQLALLTD